MFDKLKSKTIIMNLFDNMHGLKGCIRCLTFKNVLLAHFLLAFSVAGSVSAEALPTSYLNGIEHNPGKLQDVFCKELITSRSLVLILL